MSYMPLKNWGLVRCYRTSRSSARCPLPRDAPIRGLTAMRRLSQRLKASGSGGIECKCCISFTLQKHSVGELVQLATVAKKIQVPPTRRTHGTIPKLAGSFLVSIEYIVKTSLGMHKPGTAMWHRTQPQKEATDTKIREPEPSNHGLAGPVALSQAPALTTP